MNHVRMPSDSTPKYLLTRAGRQLQVSFGRALSIMLPPYCLVCRIPLRSARICGLCIPQAVTETALQRCDRCFSALLPNEAAHGPVCYLCRTHGLLGRSMRFLWDYDEQAKDFIGAMKYRPSRTLCKYAALMLAHALTGSLKTPEIYSITPIPSSPSSLRERGFNQCAIIAKHFARTTNSRYTPQLLSHCGCPAPQASLAPHQRFTNVRYSFRASPLAKGRHVILIDDVITTGATIAAATQTLLKNGASSVEVIALARSPRWGRYRSEIKKRFDWSPRTTG